VLIDEEPVLSKMEILQRHPQLNAMVRKEVTRSGVTPKYNLKRRLLPDGIHTTGLPVEAYMGPHRMNKEVYTDDQPVKHERCPVTSCGVGTVHIGNKAVRVLEFIRRERREMRGGENTFEYFITQGASQQRRYRVAIHRSINSFSYSVGASVED
jgi:hypothetical protein